jgi:uracil-DNA glycosylase
MFKELDQDEKINFEVPNHGDLSEWANQGVMMLNAVLTVTASKANSHKNQGP